VQGGPALFVWQPVPTVQYDLVHHALYGWEFAYFRAHQRSRFGYALMHELRPDLGPRFRSALA
jgi:hypothetical protein